MSVRIGLSSRSSSRLQRAFARGQGGCLTNWPPLIATSVTAGEGLDADLLYVGDVDGRRQVIYDGWPLYDSAADAEPGDVHGRVGRLGP